MNTFRLDHLSLQNFRCFSECEVQLHPQLTVLVAENGQGKTAILDAISIVLQPVIDQLTTKKQWSGIDEGDVSRRLDDGSMHPQLPTRIDAQGVLDGRRLDWGVTRASVAARSRTSTLNLAGMKSLAMPMRGRLDDFAKRSRDLPPPLPLIAHYGTGRLWAEQRLTKRRRKHDLTILGRLSGYLDSLSSDSSFRAFSSWYGETAHWARSPSSVAARHHEKPVRMLSAVRNAVSVVLRPTGWQILDWEYPPESTDGRREHDGYLVVEHESNGRLPLSRMSDGVRNMVALIADVAHRCVRLNPEFGEDAARRTPGLLLIDEIDMHLHPSWQQEVMELISRTFPQVQVIVTTHSPQVLSTVDCESIRVIRLRPNGRGEMELPAHQTRGVESADVLARVMGVHGVPRLKESRMMTTYRALVQEGRDLSDEASHLWLKLIEHFGEDHPLMDEMRTLQRLQEFKRSIGERDPGGQ